jgi:hypothetical protein
MSDAPVNSSYVRKAVFHISHPNEIAKALASWIRTLVGSNEFFLIPVAIVIGVFSDVVVTGMSEIAQLAGSTEQ